MRRLLRIVGRLAAMLLVLWLIWWVWPPDKGIAGDQRRTGYLDMHAHVAGIGAGGSGCFISEKMRKNIRFPFFLRAMGVTVAELERDGDALLIERLVQRIRDSRRVGQAVILALDGIVGPDGELDRQRTVVYVPNDYVAAQAARHEELWFGASINPYRSDALERLERAHAQGAVLVKWIPAIMHIDPADPSIEPFYRRLAELGLPLLSHAGQERSFPDARDEYSDPLKLELPLSLGVTVIAAHIGTTGHYDGQPSYERLLPLFERHEHLYTEISSLTQVNKLGYLVKALAVPGLQDRLLYGSDWPLQMRALVHPLYHLPRLSVPQARAIANLDNDWDRDVALKEILGVTEPIFQRSRELLLE